MSKPLADITLNQLEADRWQASQAARESAYTTYVKECHRLSAEYKAALLAGDGPRAEAARAAGVKLINSYHGVAE